MKFSVILNAYNIESEVALAIQSVIYSTYSDWELLIIDDGSTDNTLKEIYRFQDDRIRVFELKHVGLGRARNFGIQKSTGEYILFLDGDDAIDENLMSRLAKILKSCHYDWIYFNWATMDKTFKGNNVSKRKVMTYAAWNKCYSRSLISKLKFTEDVIFEDIGFFINAYNLAKRKKMLNEIGYFHRTREGSITTSKISPIERTDALKSIDEVISKSNDFSKSTMISCIYSHLMAIMTDNDSDKRQEYIAVAMFAAYINSHDFKLSHFRSRTDLLTRTIHRCVLKLIIMGNYNIAKLVVKFGVSLKSEVS